MSSFVTGWLSAAVLAAPVWTPVGWSSGGAAPDLAAGEAGSVHLAWLDGGAVGYVHLGPAGEVLFEGIGGGWAGVGNGWAFGPAVASGDGQVLLAWSSPKGGNVHDGWVATLVGGAWSGPDLVQPDTLRGYAAQAAADSTGASVAFLEATDTPYGHANHYRFVGGAFADQQGAVSAGRVDDRLDLVAGPAAGERHLFVGFPNPNGAVRWRRTLDGGQTWSDQPDLQGGPCGGRIGQPDAQLGPDGHVHVVYGCASDGDVGGSPSVRYARIEGGSKVHDEVVTAPGELESWHLTLGIGRVAVAPGAVAVAYLTRDTGALRVVTSLEGGGWSEPHELAGQGGDAEGRNAPAAVASGGSAWVAWAEPKTIRLAKAELAEPEPPPPPPPPPELEVGWVPGAPDGDLSEWEGIPETEFEHWIPLNDAPQTTSATFRLGRSGDRLRIAVTVQDDQWIFDEPGTLWKGDSIQVAVDPGHEKTPGAWDADDIEIGVAPGQAADCYTPAACQVEHHTVVDGDTMTAEIDLAGVVTGAPIGFTILVNETDDQGRAGWLEWTPGIGAARDPSAFGTLHFTGDPPPEPEPSPAPEASPDPDVVAPAPDADTTEPGGHDDPGPGIGLPPVDPDPTAPVPSATSGGCSSAGAPGPATLLVLLLLCAAVRAERRVAVRVLP